MLRFFCSTSFLFLIFWVISYFCGIISLFVLSCLIAITIELFSASNGVGREESSGVRVDDIPPFVVFPFFLGGGRGGVRAVGNWDSVGLKNTF